MKTVADFVKAYLERGLAVLDLPTRSKRPNHSDWQNVRVDLNSIEKHFPPGIPKNVAVYTGAPSNNLVDFDLDTTEACKAAAVLLPSTGWIFGRTSEPKSHWLFRTDLPFGKGTEKFLDIDNKTVLLELRGTGGFTVFPGSIHPSGEPITWCRFEDPA